MIGLACWLKLFWLGLGTSEVRVGEWESSRLDEMKAFRLGGL